MLLSVHVGHTKTTWRFSFENCWSFWGWQFSLVPSYLVADRWAVKNVTLIYSQHVEILPDKVWNLYSKRVGPTKGKRKNWGSLSSGRDSDRLMHAKISQVGQSMCLVYTFECVKSCSDPPSHFEEPRFLSQWANLWLQPQNGPMLPNLEICLIYDKFFK